MGFGVDDEEDISLNQQGMMQLETKLNELEKDLGKYTDKKSDVLTSSKKKWVQKKSVSQDFRRTFNHLKHQTSTFGYQIENNQE